MRSSIKVAVSLLLFGVLLYYVDWRMTWRVLRAVDPPGVVLAFGALLAGLIISTWKWRLLLSAQQVILAWPRLLRAYWIGSFFNNCLPSSVGGDLVRLFVLRDAAATGKIAASIAVERLSGLVVLLVLAGLGLAMRPGYFDHGPLLVLLWVGTIGIGLLIVSMIVLTPLIHRFIRQGGWIDRPRLALMRSKIAVMVDSLERYQTAERRWAVFVALNLSLLFYGSLIAFQYSVIAAVGGRLPLLEVSLIAPVIPLVALLPISLNGLGLTEGAFVLFYTQAGLSPEQALAAAVLRRAVMLLFAGAGGLQWWSGRSRMAEA